MAQNEHSIGAAYDRRAYCMKEAEQMPWSVAMLCDT